MNLILKIAGGLTLLITGAAIVLALIAIAAVVVLDEIAYGGTERRIRSEMKDVPELTFDFCYEAKCFYDYEDETHRFSVTVTRRGDPRHIQRAIAEVRNDWSKANVVCHSYNDSAATDGKRWCELQE